MKKVLYGTTALIAAGLIAAPADAAEKIKLGLGGYMQQWLGYADQDDFNNADFRKWDVQSDSEVFVTGSTKLDNGIDVTVMVEMEADEGNTGQDESWVRFTGGFGQLILGSQDGAHEILNHAPPDVGMGEGDVNNWVNVRSVTITEDTYVDDDAADATKITYFTPTFNGFIAGVSFTPSPGDTAASALEDTQTNAENGVTLALGYDGKFGDVGVGADLGYYTASGSANSTTDGLRAIGGNLRLTFGGFGAGGSYTRIIEKAGTGVTTSVDGYVQQLGVDYKTGPYAVSLLWHDEAHEGAAGGKDDEATHWLLSGKYDLGGGIDLRGTLFKAEFKNEGTGDQSQNENDGWGLVVGTNISF